MWYMNMYAKNQHTIDQFCSTTLIKLVHLFLTLGSTSLLNLIRLFRGITTRLIHSHKEISFLKHLLLTGNIDPSFRKIGFVLVSRIIIYFVQ